MLYTLPDGRVVVRPDCPPDLTQALEPSKRQIFSAWNALVSNLSEEQMKDLEAALSTIRKVLRVE